MKDKLELIEDILNNDEALNTYISEIEKENIKTPKDLKDNVLNYISNSSIQKKKVKLLDILKIAACTILSVFLWEMLPMDNSNNLMISEDVPQENIESVDTTDFFKELSNFMFKPINFERREK